MSDYVAVIGAANIDIGGQPSQTLIPRDSNSGLITVGYGGVARNIAHNLCKLGVPVKLFTTVGEDALGRDMLDNCRHLGMDVSNVLINENDTSSMYVFITDVSGDMALAIDHIKINKLSPEYFADKMDIINDAKLVIVDCNISQESFDYLAKNCTAPMFVDPVSTAHAKKIGKNFPYIDTLKPNALEAEFLTGMTIRTEEDAMAAARALVEAGIKKVFLSMGPEGIVAADADHVELVPSCPAEMICATGAGDSSMAAIAWSYYNDNEDIIEAARAGNAVASLTIESVDAINPALCAETLLRKIQEVY